MLEAPGRDRFLDYTANKTAHAWLLRHPGPQRPWVVCVPGYRMGHPAVDFAGFRAQWLHKTLGLNVAIFVMPFHGPRTVGRRGGDGDLSGDFLDTIHAQAQAVWDLRRMIGWLRRQGAPAIGVHGVSLGGYTAALLAALEPELERVVLGIPTACFIDLTRANIPGARVRAAAWLGFPLAQIQQTMKVVSPLGMPARVAKKRAAGTRVALVESLGSTARALVSRLACLVPDGAVGAESVARGAERAHDAGFGPGRGTRARGVRTTEFSGASRFPAGAGGAGLGSSRRAS